MGDSVSTKVASRLAFDRRPAWTGFAELLVELGEQRGRLDQWGSRRDRAGRPACLLGGVLTHDHRIIRSALLADLPDLRLGRPDALPPERLVHLLRGVRQERC